MQTLEQQFMNLVKQEFNKKKIPDITLDAAFRKDLGLDSLSLTELILACEEMFNIEIDVDHPETAQATTLRSLYNAIVQLTGQNESTK
jgi:acyl carrier protein